MLVVFFYRGFKNTTRYGDKYNLFISFMLTVLYALSDEFHQTRVYGRTGRPFDIGVDSLGALGGVLFLWQIIERLPLKAREFLRKAGV